MTERPIRFFHRAQVVSLDGVAPTRTVVEWLREQARCTGTKEGCAEGDCGACTVVVGELRDGELALNTVNACTAFIPTLDGKALFTVEDLGGHHPAQEAMVQCHGSQCGFCTPGFVMSMFACYENAAATPTRQALADALAGNLCRCTGYRPILDAGQAMFEMPPQRLDRAPAAQALRTLAAEPSLAYAHDGTRFWAPRTVDELAALREQHPQATLLAGSTDIGLWVNKQFRALGDVIYLGAVRELQSIEERDGALHIGAGATLENAWGALVARWPQLRTMWLRFASPPVRNAGTMGGNVANGSPIGDSAPVLIAMNASLVLRRGGSTRTLPLETFYVDYMKNRLEPGEFVQAIVVPLAQPSALQAYKLSKRYDSDISAVACGFALDVDAGGLVRSARFAYGGMAAVVKRAANAEAAVVGQPWTEATVRNAMAALKEDFTPLTDLRASAAYRRHTAANLLYRFWLSTRGDALDQPATSVWHLETTA